MPPRPIRPGASHSQSGNLIEDDMMHFLRKLGGTVRILGRLFMARTFGEYRHSGWDGSIAYARYSWRGKDWIIPTGAVDEVHK